MTFKCSGVDITPDALHRVSLAAHEWSTRPELTGGQQAMARTLEHEAARLAIEPASRKDIALIKQMCCHLFAVVNDGAKPDRTQWPCAPRGDAAALN